MPGPIYYGRRSRAATQKGSSPAQRAVDLRARGCGRACRRTGLAQAWHVTRFDGYDALEHAGAAMLRASRDPRRPRDGSHCPVLGAEDPGAMGAAFRRSALASIAG
jgi:hypothetical protein